MSEKDKIIPEAQIGKTPQGAIVAETPKSAQPAVTRTWGGMIALLGDPNSRYGALQVGDRISMSTKVKMLGDPVIGFAVAYISAKLVRAEYEIQCADAEIKAFFEAMYAAFHREFMLQAAMAVPLGCTGLIKKLRFELPKPVNVEDPVPWNYGPTPYICTGFDQVEPTSSWPTFDKDGTYTGFQSADGQIDRIYSLWLSVGRARAFGKYSGWGRLNNAYKAWWLGEFGYDQLAVHMQKFVDRVVMVNFPPGKDQEGNEISDAALTLGDNVRSGATAAIPSTVYRVFDESVGQEKLTAIRKWAVRLLESAENIQAFLGLADHTDARKAMGMLVPLQTFQAVQQSALGGPTTSDVLGKLATEQLIEDATDIDMHVNEYLFPFILHANFGPDAAPVTKVTTGLHESDRKEMFELMKALVTRGQGGEAEIDFEKLAHRLNIPTQPVTVRQDPAPDVSEDENEDQGEGKSIVPAWYAVSTDPYSPGHNGKLIDRYCPLDGCESTQVVQFEDHGGLCVCVGCGRTFDPEVYP